MTIYRLRSAGPLVLAVALLAACATPPAGNVEAPAPVKRVDNAVRIDESSMLPLLGYPQQLSQLSAPELARERRMLAALPQSPTTQVRLAIVLGQTRGATDLARALALLDKVLKSSDPAAASLHPLAQMLTSQYQERQKLQSQNDKLLQQLNENQRRSADLQQKLDALAAIERSLAVRPSGGESLPGSVR
jgi:hypothetical protein